MASFLFLTCIVMCIICIYRSCDRKEASKLVVQCRRRILSRRRSRAIQRWCLWTRERVVKRNNMSIASNHHRFRLFLGGSPSSTRQSKLLSRWHEHTQHKINTRNMANKYVRIKFLRNWKKRVVNKTEAKLGMWVFET